MLLLGNTWQIHILQELISLLIALTPTRNIHIRVIRHLVSFFQSILLVLFDRLPSNAEPFNACRHTAVARCLQYYFSYFFLRGAIVQSTFDVRCKLSPAVLTAEHGDVQEGADLEVEAGTSPDAAPAGFGDVLCMVSVEECKVDRH